MIPAAGIGPIQSGVPLPASVPAPAQAGASAERPSRFHLGRLGVGQSVFVAGRLWPAARTALRNHRRDHPGWGFVAEAERDGVRFWRTV